MLTIDLSNIFAIDPVHGITKDAFEKNKDLLALYLKQYKSRGHHFHDVFLDKKVTKDLKQIAKKVQGAYKHIVVLGIGGSALGTLCLQQSLTHLFGYQKKKNVPTLHVLDNIDPVLIQEIQDVINLKKTMFVVVSKSGGTPETLSQFFYFYTLLKKKKLSPTKQMIFITDPKNGLLREIADAEEIPTIDHADVGGRFSVLSSVGLFPAALMGLNIDKLIAGAQDMRDSFLSPSFAKNLPFQLAAMQYALAQKGKTIHVAMPYAQKLIRFADWYRQLLAESIGKEKDRDGNTVNVGITPVNALGATDQHSQSQLYNEGAHDKLIMFIAAKKLGNTVKIPMPYPKDDRVSYLKNTSFNELIDVERQGTAGAYTKNNRPNLTIIIDAIDEYHLGQLFMLFEGATAFLGEFYNINAYDQPGVELAKQLTKKILLQKKI